MNRRILYIRNFANKVNPASYNLQEIGFGKALIKMNFDCDIIYYHEDKQDITEIVEEHNNYKLRILWIKGIKLLSNSLYMKVLTRRFLDQYELIITTEYNQLMTFFLSILCPEKLILYHGPYEDNNHRLIQKVFDKFFLPQIKKGVKHGFVKSDLAKAYLMNKGFTDINTLGVGLDQGNIAEKQFNTDIEERLLTLKGNNVLLYIGVLEERRNIFFLLQTFKMIVNSRRDVRLLIVGDGKNEDKNKYFEYIKDHDLEDCILYLPKVDQRHLWQVFNASDVMMFPTNYDIFGMVLLESMFFEVPVISSINGGSVTLIQNNLNGIIVREYDAAKWAEETIRLLDNQELRERIIKAASNTVKEMEWGNIAKKMLRYTNSLRRGEYIEEGSTGS